MQLGPSLTPRFTSMFACLLSFKLLDNISESATDDSCTVLLDYCIGLLDLNLASLDDSIARASFE